MRILISKNKIIYALHLKQYHSNTVHQRRCQCFHTCCTFKKTWCTFRNASHTRVCLFPVVPSWNREDCISLVVVQVSGMIRLWFCPVPVFLLRIYHSKPASADEESLQTSVYIRVFSTPMPPSNENKSCIKVETGYYWSLVNSHQTSTFILAWLGHNTGSLSQF